MEADTQSDSSSLPIMVPTALPQRLSYDDNRMTIIDNSPNEFVKRERAAAVNTAPPVVDAIPINTNFHQTLEGL